MRIESVLTATFHGTVPDTYRHPPCQAHVRTIVNARCAGCLIKLGTSVTSGTDYISPCIRSAFPVPESVPALWRSRDTAIASAKCAEASNSATPGAACSQAARSERAPRLLRCEAYGPHSAAGASLTPPHCDALAERAPRRELVRAAAAHCAVRYRYSGGRPAPKSPNGLSL